MMSFLWVRAMAQAVSRRPLRTVVLVRSQVIPCGICSGNRSTEQVLLRLLTLLPVSIISPMLILINSSTTNAI